MFLLKADNKYTYKPCIAVVAFLLAAYLPACHHNKKQEKIIEPSFYYWKSVLNIGHYEKQKMDSLHIKTLYIKLFDVDWDEGSHQPVPVAKLQHAAGYKLPDSITVIPTVFITNECLLQMDTAQIAPLANNIYSLIQGIINTNGYNSIAEIQLDCDWSSATKEKYFALLKKTKALWQNSVIPLSATIRLHQIKFMEKAGIPPVDKGLLMCYNMGNLKSVSATNSILDPEEVRKFSARIGNYPLPLDVALPLFEWKVFFRNGEYKGLIKDLPDDSLKSSTIQQTKNIYTFTKDTSIQHYSFREGDVLRNETSSMKDILATTALLSSKLKNTRCRVALFHLDSLILSKYSTHELESIYSGLR